MKLGIENNSQFGLIDNNELSKGTETSEGTNWVPHFELGDGGADGVDDTGIIGARNERQRNLLLVRSENLQVIGVVQARGFDSHPHRRWRFQFWDGFVLLQHYRGSGVIRILCWVTQFPANQSFHFFFTLPIEKVLSEFLNPRDKF